jgi:hypothetical protein
MSLTVLMGDSSSPIGTMLLPARSRSMVAQYNIGREYVYIGNVRWLIENEKRLKVPMPE